MTQTVSLGYLWYYRWRAVCSPLILPDNLEELTNQNLSQDDLVARLSCHIDKTRYLYLLFIQKITFHGWIEVACKRGQTGLGV